MAGQEQLTIQLPLPDAEFAKEFAARNHISVSELFDKLLKNLQRVSTHRIDPEIQSWIGILPKDTDIDAVRMDYHRISPKVKSWEGILPNDMDIDAVRMDYLNQKYLTDEDNG